MGASRWSDDDYKSYAKSTNHETLSRAQVFTSRYLPEALDPSKLMVNSGPTKGQRIRESRDSDSNPHSTPIIIGLDVTGSMGFVAEYIAKTGLAKLMGDIYETRPVPDPHILFAGVGDVRAYDKAPLQVSQFEPDIKIIEQLRTLYLEGGGGGNREESYDLPWYFAANKTVHDSFDKRGEKGFIFTIGDEPPPEQPLTAAQIKQLFGEGSGDLPVPASIKATLAAAQETYTVFHIVAEEGDFFSRRPEEVTKKWNDLMGANVLYMKNCKDLPEIILATLRISNGEDVSTVIRESKNQAALLHAFRMNDGF